MSAKAMFRQVSNRFRGPQVVGLSRAEDSAVNWLASDSSDRSSVRAGGAVRNPTVNVGGAVKTTDFTARWGLVLALYVLDSIFC